MKTTNATNGTLDGLSPEERDLVERNRKMTVPSVLQIYFNDGWFAWPRFPLCFCFDSHRRWGLKHQYDLYGFRASFFYLSFRAFPLRATVRIYRRAGLTHETQDPRRMYWGAKFERWGESATPSEGTDGEKK
jgi:hypothetical protein